MKKNPLLLILGFVLCASSAQAQMFFSSSYDKGVKESAETPKSVSVIENDPETDGIPHAIRDRLRLNAARILVKPDEVYCYGIARKNPKVKSETISGYALTGTCGNLNEEGLAAVKEKIFTTSSFDMTTTKISAACVIKPKLLLRFRRGVDFVDMVFSGDKCPGLVYLYAGDSKEFYAKPIADWLDTFITAVSNDIEPLENEEETKKSQQIFIRKRTVEEEQAVVPAADTQQDTSDAPKVWGRRFN